MQIVTVTKSALFSEFFTLAMLTEVGVRYLGMSDEAVAKTATATLAKASKTMAGISYAKLRTVIATKLGNHPDYNDTFNEGKLELEFDCLPDLDIGKAGANKRTRKAAPAGDATGTTKRTTGATPRTGAYKVAKRAGNAEADAGKWEIWQHVWSCTSFDDYFAKAPAKGVTKTGRVITAASEMGWAIKSGWIVPEVAEQTAE